MKKIAHDMQYLYKYMTCDKVVHDVQYLYKYSALNDRYFLHFDSPKILLTFGLEKEG